MSLNIDFLDETNEVSEAYFTQLEDLLNFTAKKEEVQAGSELSVTFVSNEQIQSINKEYRGKDYATDVISFALEELGEGELEIIGEGIPRFLGDIIISVKKAEEQAVEYGHSFERELGFLAVHGLLHLLGYDHETEEEEKVMFDRQRDILNEFGLQR